VTVALSGDGGDETFLGYERYVHARRLSRAGRWLGPSGRNWLRGAAQRMPIRSRWRRPLQRMAQEDVELYCHALGFSDERLGMLRPEVRARLLPTLETKLAADFRSVESGSLLDRYAFVDLMNYLPSDVLTKVDRASMRHSLEVRCPLLDQEWVELAQRIPSRFKLRGRTGKRLLRRLLERHLPAALVTREKAGFGVPLDRWFRAELAPRVQEMLNDRASPMWEFFDRAQVAQRVRDHASGRVNLQGSLWRALFFHHWMRMQAAGSPAGGR
jgi:asparagine synthase (glutamine-hydrolysing)